MEIWRVGRMARMAGFASAICCANSAFAGLDNPVNFDVPAGDLATVVTSISRQGGTPISYASELTNGLMSGPVRGKFTVRGALGLVLSGKGLTPIFSPSGSVMIIKASTPSPAAANDAATDIPDIDVAGATTPFQDNGFQAGDAGSTLNLGSTPLKSSSRTINTVTQDVIKTRGDTNVNQTLQNVAGVNFAPGQLGSNQFTIRGFQNTNFSAFVNGNSAASFGQIPIDEVERVDVLKGPTSILTGVTSAGGAVNVETKQPTDQTIHNAVVRYGSYNYATLAIDYGGVVPKTDGLTYRFNLSGNTAERNFAGYVHPHEFLVAPAIQWKDQFNSITAGLRYYDQRLLPGQYSFVPAVGADPVSPVLRLPRGLAQITPDLGASNRTLSLDSKQSHDFGSVLGAGMTLNNQFSFTSTTANLNYFQYLTSIFTPARAGQIHTPYDLQNITDRADITLKYDAGFAQQTSIFGLDYRLLRNNSSQTFGPTSTIDPLTASPQFPLYGRGPNPVSSTYTYSQTNNLGYYYQEKFDLFNNRFHILGNVRKDSYQSQLISASLPASPFASLSSSGSGQTGLSWTAGGAFDLTPWVTLYGNRSAGFLPIPASLVIFPPETLDNSEVGARFYFFDKNLTVTTAFFDDITKNVSYLTDATMTNFVTLSGQVSKGFEIEAQGQVLPGLNLTVAFSDINTSYSDQRYNFPLPGVPQYTGNVWATYSFDDPVLRGFTIGFGAHGNTRSSLNNSVNASAPTYYVPGYVVEDALIGYSNKNYSIEFKMNNITNKYFMLPSYTSSIVSIGQGRNFLLTGRYAFD